MIKKLFTEEKKACGDRYDNEILITTSTVHGQYPHTATPAFKSTPILPIYFASSINNTTKWTANRIPQKNPDVDAITQTQKKKNVRGRYDKQIHPTSHHQQLNKPINQQLVEILWAIFVIIMITMAIATNHRYGNYI